MGEDKDMWESIIRSCILTSKTPLTPVEINRDTKMLEGNNIPFTKFGYRTLEDMLRNIPDLQVFQQNGKTVVRAIANEKTAHIQRMIRLQKSKSKKKPRTLPSFMNRMNSTFKNTPVYRNQTSTPRNSVPNRNNQQTRSVANQNFNRPTTLNQQPQQMQKQKPSPLLPTPTAQPQIKRPVISNTPVIPIIPSTPVTSVPFTNNVTPLLRQPTTNRPAQVVTPVSTPLQQKSVTFASNVESQRPLSAQQRIQVARHEEAPVVRPTPAPVTSTLVPKNLSGRLIAAKTGVPDDPRLRLLQYTKNRNLADPKYKAVTIVKDKNLYCAVTIEKDRKFGSYPTPAKTMEDAEKIAAEKALQNLLPQYDVPNVVTQNKNLLLQRVTEIVNQHPNGILEAGVVKEYESRFHEKLLEDWLNFIKNYIKVDVGANDVRFLCPQKENVHILSPQKESTIANHNSVLSPELDILNYQDLDKFYLNIINVFSTTDIWAIIIDENHSDKLFDLAQEMRPFYENNDLTVKNVTEENYYTIFDSEWHRVYCLEYNKDKDEATVFFIDRGDSDVFPSNRLRTLTPEFLKLPWQAVRISLKDLELFEDLSEAQVVLEDLIDKDVMVKSAVKDPDAKGKNLSFVSVELESVDDNCVDINEYLSKCILEKVNPMYIVPDKITQEVHISFVSEQAIYVQVLLKGKQQLDRLIDQVKKDILENVYHKTRPVSNFDLSKVYMTRSKEDNEWYRIKLVNVINDKEARAFCIDFGHEMTVKKTDLVLDDLPELLTSYPAQAVKVSLYKMSKFTFNERILNRLRQLAPRTEVFYMKIMDLQDNIPVVNFYQRTESNLLASLSDTLIMEQEIKSRDDNNNARRLRNDRLFLGTKSDFPLPTPNIAAIELEFDICVTLAAHPNNFTVQPLSSAQDLKNMMTELSQVCKSYTGPVLTPSSIKTGTIYAAKYDGCDKWYRGYVSKILSKNVCVIYYVDYGDYRTVTTDQLQILDKRFLTLPYQAIKAKLYGIEPKLKGDWSVDDSLRFIELTVNKNFVSIVKSIESDTTNLCGMIIGLELVDTSTAENIYISNVLVKEKRAEKIRKV